jgi:ribonucleotide monophosphatase NagD (HAD superfamily)
MSFSSNVIWKGTGCIVAAVEYASQRTATVVGKPSPTIETALREMLHSSYNPSRTVMVGDRLETDIAFGTLSGFQTLLVETGVHNMLDAEKLKVSEQPNYIIASLGNISCFVE